MSTCTIVSVLPGGIACKIGQHWPTHKQLKEGNRQYGSENYNTNGDERSYQLSHVWRQWPEVVPDQDPQNVDKQVCWIISQFNAVYLSTWRNFSQVTMNRVRSNTVKTMWRVRTFVLRALSTQQPVEDVVVPLKARLLVRHTGLLQQVCKYNIANKLNRLLTLQHDWWR